MPFDYDGYDDYNAYDDAGVFFDDSGDWDDSDWAALDDWDDSDDYSLSDDLFDDDEYFAGATDAQIEDAEDCLDAATEAGDMESAAYWSAEIRRLRGLS